jgi:hypothetical protein
MKKPTGRYLSRNSIGTPCSKGYIIYCEDVGVQRGSCFFFINSILLPFTNKGYGLWVLGRDNREREDAG